VEEEVTPLPTTEAVIWLDMGVSALVTISSGDNITHPRHFAHSRSRLKTAQKALARKEK
jgi:putative transposase